MFAKKMLLGSSISISRRIIFHLLLAAFLANAANKFFVVELEAEIAHGFYARIFDFVGDAPDQYRILPLLPLKLLCQWLPFNHAVLAYNVIFGFISFELLWLLNGNWADRKRLLLNLVLASSFIFLQYTGWRPDTIGLLAVCLAGILAVQRCQNEKLKIIFLGFGILALSFSRADVALVYAVFWAFFLKDLRLIIFAIIPIIVQLSLQLWIFPHAHYYTKTLMLFDNLRLYYLLRNPLSYLILAVVLIFWKELSKFLRNDIRENFYFYGLLLGFVGLVMFVGRLNEFRLYLPFLPLFLLMTNERRIKGK